MQTNRNRQHRGSDMDDRGRDSRGRFREEHEGRHWNQRRDQDFEDERYQQSGNYGNEQTYYRNHSDQNDWQNNRMSRRQPAHYVQGEFEYRDEMQGRNERRSAGRRYDRRGFGGMSRHRVRQFASMGGRATQERYGTPDRDRRGRFTSDDESRGMHGRQQERDTRGRFIEEDDNYSNEYSNYRNRDSQGRYSEDDSYNMRGAGRQQEQDWYDNENDFDSDINRNRGANRGRSSSSSGSQTGTKTKRRSNISRSNSGNSSSRSRGASSGSKGNSSTVNRNTRASSGKSSGSTGKKKSGSRGRKS